jgi:hypothetical protein
MAEARMLKTDEAKEKSSNITSKRRKERSSRESRAQVDGAEKLRQAADRRVGQHSKKIADLLVANALKGDLPSIGGAQETTSGAEESAMAARDSTACGGAGMGAARRSRGRGRSAEGDLSGIHINAPLAGGVQGAHRLWNRIEAEANSL